MLVLDLSILPVDLELARLLVLCYSTASVDRFFLSVEVSRCALGFDLQAIFCDIPEIGLNLRLPKIADRRFPVEERVVGIGTVIEGRGRVLVRDGEVHHVHEELIVAGEIDHLLGDQDIGRELVDHQPEVVLARGAHGSWEVQQVPGDELYGFRGKREKKKNEDEK